MNTMTMVRYTTRPDVADENQRLVEAVFEQLAATAPDGVRYATFRLADEVTFVHIVAVDGNSDDLSGLTAFQEFQKGIGDRCVEPPHRTETTVVGSYGFLDGI